MSKFSKGVGEFVGEIIAWAIGWLFCLAMLVGAYGLGWWLGPYIFGESNDRGMFGLLSALTLIWIYEHRNLEFKYNRLQELLGLLVDRNR